MRTLLLLCALALPASLAAQDKTKDLIVGKWEWRLKLDGKEIVQRMDFTTDGKLVATVEATGAEKLTFEGTYKVIDETTLETTLPLAGKFKTDKQQCTVTKETLELTTAAGEKSSFKKLK